MPGGYASPTWKAPAPLPAPAGPPMTVDPSQLQSVPAPMSAATIPVQPSMSGTTPRAPQAAAPVSAEKPGAFQSYLATLGSPDEARRAIEQTRFSPDKATNDSIVKHQLEQYDQASAGTEAQQASARLAGEDRAALAHEQGAAIEKQRKDFEAQTEAHRVQFEEKWDQLDADVAKMRQGGVDPNRYVSNMSVPTKILSGLGVLLSSLGGKASVESAVGIIQHDVDNDIRAQEKDIDLGVHMISERGQLLHQFQQMMPTPESAAQMLKAYSLDHAAQQLEEEMALSGIDVSSAEAQAKLQALQNAAKQQYDLARIAAYNATRPPPPKSAMEQLKEMDLAATIGEKQARTKSLERGPAPTSEKTSADAQVAFLRGAQAMGETERNAQKVALGIPKDVDVNDPKAAAAAAEAIAARHGAGASNGQVGESLE